MFFLCDDWNDTHASADCGSYLRKREREITMPNWCKGSLKIRGTEKNIKAFLENGVENADIEYDGQYVIIQNEKGPLYIKGTRRHFLNQSFGKEENFLYELGDGRFCISFPNFAAAWNIDAESLAEISKEYGIDFKIFAFECGIEFNRDILIINGKIERDDVIKYDNYVWDCICPEIGG